MMVPIPSHNFFFKMAAILQNYNFVRFQWKLISWGILMWRSWWYYGIFFKFATILHKCHLCPILRKNYSLQCFDVVNMMVLSTHFSQLSIFFIMAAMTQKCHLCLISKKKWLPFSRIGFQVSDIGSSRASFLAHLDRSSMWAIAITMRPPSSLTFSKNLLLKNCKCYRLETLGRSSIGYLDYKLCPVCSPGQKHGRRY